MLDGMGWDGLTAFASCSLRSSIEWMPVVVRSLLASEHSSLHILRLLPLQRYPPITAIPLAKIVSRIREIGSRGSEDGISFDAFYVGAVTMSAECDALRTVVNSEQSLRMEGI